MVARLSQNHKVCLAAGASAPGEEVKKTELAARMSDPSGCQGNQLDFNWVWTQRAGGVAKEINKRAAA